MREGPISTSTARNETWSRGLRFHVPRPSITMHFGLFGGTFDPPHLGHLIVAETLREHCELDRVVWMVAASPPHKQDRVSTPADDRLALVRAAIAGNSHFEASDLELRRNGPSYTVDTLRALHARQPGVRWSLLVGGDSFATFDTWREPDEIARLAEIVVYHRSGYALPLDTDVPARFVEAGRVDISSTEIRTRLQAGRSVRYLVPEAVRTEIGARRLYTPDTVAPLDPVL